MDLSRGFPDICYDPTVITGPKTFHLQRLSIFFGLMAPCQSRRQPGVPPTPTAEIFLPTKAQARYPDHICNFSQPDDNWSFWQVSAYLSLPSGSPFSGDNGPGFRGHHPAKNLQTKVVVCIKSAKKILFEWNLCYPAFQKKGGLENSIALLSITGHKLTSIDC